MGIVVPKYRNIAMFFDREEQSPFPADPSNAYSTFSISENV